MKDVKTLLNWFLRLWGYIPTPVFIFCATVLGLTLFLIVLRKIRG